MQWKTWRNYRKSTRRWTKEAIQKRQELRVATGRATGHKIRTPLKAPSEAALED